MPPRLEIARHRPRASRYAGHLDCLLLFIAEDDATTAAEAHKKAISGLRRDKLGMAAAYARRQLGACNFMPSPTYQPSVIFDYAAAPRISLA